MCVIGMVAPDFGRGIFKTAFSGWRSAHGILALTGPPRSRGSSGRLCQRSRRRCKPAAQIAKRQVTKRQHYELHSVRVRCENPVSPSPRGSIGRSARSRKMIERHTRTPMGNKTSATRRLPIRDRRSAGASCPCKARLWRGVDGFAARKRRFERGPNLLVGSPGRNFFMVRPGRGSREGCHAGSASCRPRLLSRRKPPAGGLPLPRVWLGADPSAGGVSDGNNSLGSAESAHRNAKVSPRADGHAACPQTYVCHRPKPVSRVGAP